jgi:DNA adenine methylase
MAYDGGKGNLYQHIINLIPPHTTYIEPFLGGGAVALKKRPALLNIGLDLDSEALLTTAAAIARSGDDSGGIAGSGGAAASSDLASAAAIVGSDGASWRFYCQDGIEFLRSYTWRGGEFVYCDPPYLLSTRSSQRPRYKFEMTRADHVRLLQVLIGLPCMVAVSSYWSSLYGEMLGGWETAVFTTYTRSNRMVKEWLWMNYPQPERLHDYSHLGQDFRERERIKRKADRWVKGLQRLPLLERQAIWSRLEELGP